LRGKFIGRLNSLRRYITNNFADDYKHECIQLIIKNNTSNPGQLLANNESKTALNFIATTWNISYNTPASDELLKDWLDISKANPYMLN
jgi:hypothetical protein